MGKETKIKRALIRSLADGKRRTGAPASGLFPEVSRVALAQELQGQGLQIDESTISYILSGRHRPKYDVLTRMAGQLGVGVEELHQLLESKRAERQRS
jgi:hypothetical protein